MITRRDLSTRAFRTASSVIVAVPFVGSLISAVEDDLSELEDEVRPEWFTADEDGRLVMTVPSGTYKASRTFEIPRDMVTRIENVRLILGSNFGISLGRDRI